MLRLQRYLLSELLATFTLIALIATAVFLSGTLLQTIQRFPQSSVLALLEAAPLFVGLALPVTLPLSFLMACLLSYGRFADDNEYVAFQMGGLSPRHAVAPALFSATLVSVFTVALCCDVNPSLTSAKKAVLRVQVGEQLERMRTSAGSGDVRIGDLEMSWSGRRGDWYLGVALTWTTEKVSDNGQDRTKVSNNAQAREATLRLTDETPARLLVKLVDGRLPVGAGDGMTVYAAKTSDIVIDIEDYNASGRGKDEMRSADLYYRMLRLEPILGQHRQSNEWRAYRLLAGEYWRRIALGLSPLAFALLGVPLGLLTRRGSRAQALVVAIVVALPVYYPLLLFGDSLSRRDVLPPGIALNLANVVLGAIGVGLLARLATR